MEWLRRAARRGRITARAAASPAILTGPPEGPRRAILHLGMNKTGSTSIQHALDGYVDRDAEYLDLGEPNHNRAMWLVFLDKPARRFYASADAAEQAAQRLDTRARLEAAMRRTRRSVIVSAEALSSFPNVESCRRVVAFLEGHVEEVKALAYVRDPASFMRGHFQQILRSAPVRLEDDHNFPAYRKRFNRWVEALGRHELELVAFEPAAFRGGDLLEDFAWRAGIDKAGMRSLGKHSNVSLSAEATAVLYLLREADGAAPLRGPGREGNSGLVRLLTGFGTSRFAFAPHLVEAAEREHAEDVAWIEARLGRPLPRPPQGAAVTFGSHEQIMAMGQELGPALADWLDAQGLADPAGRRETLPLLRAQMERFAEGGAALAAREGVRRARLALSPAAGPRGGS